ncbi:MAG: hypothetical protein J7K54_03310 [Candidatus Aenigmarchaeota archaeon]|nr:hypothetical protein [Candidatus Aenigmarchaeota archaeon]
MKYVTITVLLVLAFLGLVHDTQAATYYSIQPAKEVCTSILFGQDGGGEYTLQASDPGEAEGNPWIDNHFTSFVAGPDNIVSVPVCFSAVSRALGDEGNIHITVSTPRGNISYDYGVCVAQYSDVDITEGAATGSPCDVMGGHTDLFSASFTQPEMYARPGESAVFNLILDSSTDMTVSIAKASGDVQMRASETYAQLGGGQQEIQVEVNAPSAAGDYPFSVSVNAEGCSIDDCSRTVDGILHVADASATPKAGFFIWLSPKTKSITGQQSTQFVARVQNYGEGQEVTVMVTADEGLDTDFSPYTVFIEKGQSKSIPFNVRPSENAKASYKITAVAQGKDGTKRSAKSWLTVDEMVADADKLGQDDFIKKYNENGGASLEDWEELESLTGNVIDNSDIVFDEPPPGPGLWVYIIAAVIVAAIAIGGFIFYRKYQQTSSEQGPTWEDLGVK